MCWAPHFSLGIELCADRTQGVWRRTGKLAQYWNKVHDPERNSALGVHRENSWPSYLGEQRKGMLPHARASFQFTRAFLNHRTFPLPNVCGVPTVHTALLRVPKRTLNVNVKKAKTIFKHHWDFHPHHSYSWDSEPYLMCRDLLIDHSTFISSCILHSASKRTAWHSTVSGIQLGLKKCYSTEGNQCHSLRNPIRPPMETLIL